MPVSRRPAIPGATIFVTACLSDWESDLLLRHVGLLREAVRRSRADRPFAIEAWVTLPDHSHAVWRLPEGDADFSTRMAAIKARFTQGLGRAGISPPRPRVGPAGGATPALRRQRQTGPWQPRFWEHHIRDADDFDAHIRYCWTDPVKHRLVADPFDWRHSSIHRDMAARLATGAAIRNREAPAPAAAP
ncbi:REP-associated tyrosine transposase [Jannaschia seohaensis]|uniref:Putative transposase n=1 Tax=Jannaschia seohaensis TaxID=475081 RepID=A0A2Y9B1V1_9RHOB|nr:transposase [Jannaschia seohaensis]PWJ16995.1 putative transposase [Jannaschia seohaensis]SSA48309.1 putative transposase [Jannaschia seohaensis]